VIDLAIDHLIRAERLRRDVAAYRRVPPTDSEAELGPLAATNGLEDDTERAALYEADEG
jgi:hypothetical protein